jgi:hypothetical protein
VSERVIRDIETGARHNYSDVTLASIEAALGWAPGAALRVVQGGRVQREVDPALARLLDAWRGMSPDARMLLVDIAERAVRGQFRAE